MIISSVSNMTLFYNKSHHPNDLRLTSLNSTKVYLLWNPHSVFFLQPSEFLAYFKNDLTLNEASIVLIYLEPSVVREVSDDALSPSESCGQRTPGGRR